MYFLLPCDISYTQISSTSTLQYSKLFLSKLLTLVISLLDSSYQSCPCPLPYLLQKSDSVSKLGLNITFHFPQNLNQGDLWYFENIYSCYSCALIYCLILLIVKVSFWWAISILEICISYTCPAFPWTQEILLQGRVLNAFDCRNGCRILFMMYWFPCNLERPYICFITKEDCEFWAYLQWEVFVSFLKCKYLHIL